MESVEVGDRLCSQFQLSLTSFFQGVFEGLRGVGVSADVWLVWASSLIGCFSRRRVLLFMLVFYESWGGKLKGNQ